MTSTNEILQEALVGRQLSAVTFVMDYFQLDFDGNRLTVYGPPVISLEQEIQGGFRDRLCAFIAHDVTSVREVENVALYILFEGFGQLSVLLDEESRVTVEAAELHSAGRTILIW
ncbi:hypothetical protein L2Y96_12175 [Luteibacter aegosomaticola]|uniref:hypothetical protein n=1 Tax=Luteibacter aegosomaticola TaxID=2911538 RepID=UPI001FF9C026|nr:hypothetical protein [Luteibacter aegosomaticola]UPG88176.1 hypothetical protein L2Y96_12175 [Luteibacter aegosomaticola]